MLKVVYNMYMKLVKVHSLKPTKRVMVGAIFAIAVVCLAGGYSFNRFSAQKNESKSTGIKSESANQLHSSNEEVNSVSAVTETKPDEPQSTTPKTVTTPKYSTSSDPRSTAYSNTPPAPSVQDVEIAIVRNGQVAPGTLISSNAAKSEKAYYGGDLIGPTNLTITLDPIDPTEGSVTFTISSPDGQALTMPMRPWNDPNYKVFPANALALSASSYRLQIVAPASTQRGVYTVHLMSYRAGQGVDSWHYHKFINVTVQ